GMVGQAPVGLNGLGDGISGARRPNSEGYIHYWCLDRDLIETDSAHYLGFTLNTPGGPNMDNMDETPLVEVAIGGHYYLYILIEDGQLFSRRRYSPTGREEDVVDYETGRIDIP